MRTLVRTALMVATSLTVASCGRAPATGTPEPGGETILVVDNRSTFQVTVYALRDSQRQRLGTAGALATTRLTIPDHLVFGVTSLRFQVDPVGSRRTPISEQITVSAGEEVTLVIPATFR